MGGVTPLTLSNSSHVCSCWGKETSSVPVWRQGAAENPVFHGRRSCDCSRFCFVRWRPRERERERPCLWLLQVEGQNGNGKKIVTTIMIEQIPFKIETFNTIRWRFQMSQSAVSMEMTDQTNRSVHLTVHKKPTCGLFTAVSQDSRSFLQTPPCGSSCFYISPHCTRLQMYSLVKTWLKMWFCFAVI